MDELDGLLARVKQDAHGWLPLPVYRRIHDTAASLNGGTFVEIGTSNGAATIALALGAQKSGRPFRILTVDTFKAGTRVPGDTVEARAAGVRRRFEAFGLSDRIESIVGTSTDLVATRDPQDIGLLLIDADGRIDRDFASLHDRLAPACPIIIDDIDGRTYVHRLGRTAAIDQKHRLSRLLVERFIEAGLIEERGDVLGQTGWYAKGEAALSAARIELLALPAYRELVRVTIGSDELGPVRAMLRAAARRLPLLARAYRRIVPAPAP